MAQLLKMDAQTAFAPTVELRGHRSSGAAQQLKTRHRQPFPVSRKELKTELTGISGTLPTVEREFPAGHRFPRLAGHYHLSGHWCSFCLIPSPQMPQGKGSH